LLGPAERAAARCVPRALDAAAAAVARGEQAAPKVVAAATAVIAAEPAARLDYAEARDPETLEVVEAVNAPTLLALAVWVGSVRLIDNRVLVPGRVDR
jgi:pantoate--beta-alanine ligase